MSCNVTEHKSFWQPNEDRNGNSGDGALRQMPFARTAYDEIASPVTDFLCNTSTPDLIRAGTTAGCPGLSFGLPRSENFLIYSEWLLTQ